MYSQTCAAVGQYESRYQPDSGATADFIRIRVGPIRDPCITADAPCYSITVSARASSEGCDGEAESLDGLHIDHQLELGLLPSWHGHTHPGSLHDESSRELLCETLLSRDLQVARLPVNQLDVILAGNNQGRPRSKLIAGAAVRNLINYGPALSGKYRSKC